MLQITCHVDGHLACSTCQDFQDQLPEVLKDGPLQQMVRYIMIMNVEFGAVIESVVKDR